MRIGLIGVGEHMSENLFPALRSLPGHRVVAVTARRAESASGFASRWGIPSVCRSAGELLDPSIVDVAVVAAAPDVHAQVIELAARAGVPLFVEKPPALDLAVLTRLCDLVDLTSTQVNVGYNFRFATVIDQLAQQAGLLGTPRHARIHIAARKPTQPMWNLPSVVSSFVYAVGIHAVELACAWFGAPASITVSVNELDDTRFHASVQLRFSSSDTCEVSMTNAANRFAFDVELFGPHGVARSANLSSVEWSDFYEQGPIPKTLHSVALSGLAGGFERSGYAVLLGKWLDGDRPTPLRKSIAVYQIIERLLEESS